ncbi:carbonic anhydrase [Alteribacillus iranensis]
MEHDMESIIHQKTGIPPHYMHTIQSYGTIISHPFGDIMRSVIIAIYQESIEDICVVGVEDNHTLDNVPDDITFREGEIQTLNYLFEHCKPELIDSTFEEWLKGKEKVSKNVERSIDMIRRHPLVPSYVNVRGLLINKGEEHKVVEV